MELLGYAASLACAVLLGVVVVQHRRLRRANAVVQRVAETIDGISDALRRGEKDPALLECFANPHLEPCWRVMQCTKTECPSHGSADLRCWHVAGNLCMNPCDRNVLERVKNCAQCRVYLRAQPDPSWRLLEQVNTLSVLLRENCECVEDAKQRMAHASKLATLGEFAAGIAHEINNPLDGVMSCLLRLERDPANLTQNIEYIELMREALERMASSVQNLLEYSRRRELHLEETSIHAVIEHVVALIKVPARQNALTLRFECEDEIPPVLGDRHYLAEAFLNLALNSLAATPPGGSLTFRVRSAIGQNGLGRCAEVQVVDTGVGVSPQDLPRVFEPFFTTKEPGKGTGLGLSIVRRIVEDHRGEVQIESVPKEGTTVRVRLPLAGDEIRAGKPTTALEVCGSEGAGR